MIEHTIRVNHTVDVRWQVGEDLTRWLDTNEGSWHDEWSRFVVCQLVRKGVGRLAQGHRVVEQYVVVVQLEQLHVARHQHSDSRQRRQMQSRVLSWLRHGMFLPCKQWLMSMLGWSGEEVSKHIACTSNVSSSNREVEAEGEIEECSYKKADRLVTRGLTIDDIDIGPIVHQQQYGAVV